MLERRQAERVAQPQLGVGDHGNGIEFRSANSTWSSSGCADTPANLAPSAPSSAEWSRNPQDCGVQPRAPGIVVPTRKERFPRPAGCAGRRRRRPGPAELGEIDGAGRRVEHERGNQRSRQVVRGSVVLRSRQSCGKDVGICQRPMRRRSSSGRSGGHGQAKLDHLAVGVEQIDVGVRPLDGLVGEEEHPAALGVVVDLDRVREAHPNAGDVGACCLDAAPAAEAVPTPAAAEVDARRRRRHVAAARRPRDPARGPRPVEPVGTDEHGHRLEAAAHVLDLESDDEKAMPEHLPLLEEVDRGQVGLPRPPLERLRRRGAAADADERGGPGRLAEELVDRLLCRP